MSRLAKWCLAASVVAHCTAADASPLRDVRFETQAGLGYRFFPGESDYGAAITAAADYQGAGISVGADVRLPIRAHLVGLEVRIDRGMVREPTVLNPTLLHVGVVWAR